MRRWDGLVEGYIKECEIRGLAETTIGTRRRELERCGAWLKRRRPKVNLEGVDGPLAIAYLRTRGTFRGKGTLAGAVSIFRGMGEYLVGQGVWIKNPLRWIKGPKMDPRMSLPRRIGRAEMKRLWDEAGARKPESARKQLLCMLAVLYGTGVRRGELHRMDLADWDREAGMLTVDGRKTGQERKVPVGAGVWRFVEAYLPVRQQRLEATGRIEEPALLVGRRGTRLSGDMISHHIGQCAKRAKIPFVSIHQFRHSCASDLLESGVRMPEIKAMLGHGAIETTMRYLHVSTSARMEAIAKHPINEMLRPEGESAERSVAI